MLRKWICVILFLGTIYDHFYLPFSLSFLSLICTLGLSVRAAFFWLCNTTAQDMQKYLLLFNEQVSHTQSYLKPLFHQTNASSARFNPSSKDREKLEGKLKAQTLLR